MSLMWDILGQDKAALHPWLLFLRKEMIRMITRDTTTGAKYEEEVTLAHRHRGAIDLSKHKLYAYLKDMGIDWHEAICSKLLPDEAYLDGDTLYIYEKKFQHVNGSADEKLQTCGFKAAQYRKIAALLGAEEIVYTYILSDWFKQPKYRDVLAYINATPDCWYEFQN